MSDFPHNLNVLERQINCLKPWKNLSKYLNTFGKNWALGSQDCRASLIIPTLMGPKILLHMVNSSYFQSSD